MAPEQEGTLPPELRAFLHSCIDSIQQIELLLLMRGSERMRTARDIAAELGIPVPGARHDVESLAARGLLEVKVGEEIAYRYKPKTDDLAKYSDQLARYYITARQAVLGFVAAESRRSIKRFSDAFRLGEREGS
jgi:predicted ArsR family transcriptional regulator